MSAVSPVTEQGISVWVVAIQQNRTNTYICISAISFLFYDVLINLDREIEYVWQARWSIPKALFIFARYYGLILIITLFAVTTTVGIPLQVCRGWVWYTSFANIPVSTIVNVILAMRLYAMYKDRKALVFFILLIICGFALEVYASTKMSMQQSVIPVPTGIPMPGCIVTEPNPSIGLIAYVPMILIATAFFAMTIMRVVIDRYSTPKHLLDIKYLSPLIVVIVRDGTLFYFLIFVVLLVDTVLVSISESVALSTATVLMLWRLGIYSWSASRLVLNLRETASYQTTMGTTTMGAETITTLAVALNPMLRQHLGTKSSKSIA